MDGVGIITQHNGEAAVERGGGELPEAVVRVGPSHQVESGRPGNVDSRVSGPQWRPVQGTVLCYSGSYCSNINPLHPRDEWSVEEEMEMVELHNQLGNRWAEIGKKLGGRSDNCVKNQFYCLLRKALKRVNRMLGEVSRDIKEFKPNILYKVVEVA